MPTLITAFIEIYIHFTKVKLLVSAGWDNQIMQAYKDNQK